MIKCKINGTEYSIADGFILRDKYTEELDSGIITIPFVDKLNLSPLDFVELTDDRFNKKTFVIDTWTEDVVSFQPLKYNYNISLISETIKLQKVIMPNLGITHPLNSTKKTIFNQLNRYYNMYISKQYPELYISGDLSALTHDEICPENLFNRPTAFELFNTLLGKLNCIVKVNDGGINYIKLDEYGKKIDESKLYYETDTQNIEEYANRIDIQVTNAISNGNNFSTINGITLRGGEGEAVLNDDNMTIILDKPIYDFDTIDAVYVYFKYNYNEGERTGKAVANITDYIVEKEVYDTYLTSSSSGVLENNEKEGKYYKRNSLYYVRGSNKIEGLNYSEKNLVGDSWIALYNILYNVAKKTDDKLRPDFDESQVRDNVFFEIKYKTSDSFRLTLGKENKYNATLIDNQVETQVDAESFGKVEQDKLNRLGNKAKIITATYYKGEDIPELGDYIGDYVLAEREIVYYDDYALFKGYLYKNFVRKNMFYGLNSKKRSTQISTESVIRNDVINYDLSFGVSRSTEEIASYTSLKRYILYPLMMSDNANVAINNYAYEEFPKYCFIKTSDSYGEIVSNGGWICLTPSTYSCGKSNIIHFQFKDNFSAGIRVTGNVTGGKKQEYVKYVNDFGEMVNMTFVVRSNNRNDFARFEVGAGILETIKPIADNLPLLTTEQAQYLASKSNEIVGGSIELWKDSRETTAISLSFNYKDNEHVIIGDFAANTGIGYHYIMKAGVYICYSTTDEYETGDTYGLGKMVTDGSVSIDYTNGEAWLQHKENGVPLPSDVELDTLSLYLRNVDTSQWKSWGIVQASNNRLILGVNKGKKDVIPTKIYLKCIRKDY